MIGLGLAIPQLAAKRGNDGQFAGSSLNLDFTSGNQTLDPRITFSRASTGTRINASGVLESVAINGPRFDYDPVTLAPRGLLIEEQRTNLLLQSGWAGAVAGSPGTAPTSWSLAAVGSPSLEVGNAQYGTADAALALTFNCASAERLWVQQAINVTAGVQYAVSVWVEAVSGSAGAVITITSGTVSGTINQPVNSPSNPDRYTLLFTANGTGTISIRYGIGTTAAVSSPASIRLSRPQVEAGAFATSYIPTSGAAATRAADVAVMTGANFSNWYRQDEGALFAEGSWIGLDNFRQAVNVNDGSANNLISIQTATSPAARNNVVSGGATQAALGPGSFALGQVFKMAAGYKTNDFAAAFNGLVGGATDTSGSVPSVDRLSFGTAGAAAVTSNLHIRKIAYFPRRLSNAELQGITS